MLLAIDSATQFLSLALHDGVQVLHEQTWHSANQHTVELAPAVQTALQRTNAHLSAMAVAIGPGTYTGLRVGVSFAKALAAARNIPLVGVMTHDILAAAQPQHKGTLMVVVGAGRGRIAAVSYGWRKDRWRVKGEAATFDWETLLTGIDSPTLITGEVEAAGIVSIEAAQRDGKTVTLAPAALRLRRASFLAEEGWQRLRDTDGLAPDGVSAAFEAARVMPLYVKTKDSP